jgi:hypothetical protein
MRYDADREIAELVGLLKGIIADGVVNEEEVMSFREWLRGHPKSLKRWPAKHLQERLEGVFSDGVIDEEERVELHALFRATAIDRFDPAKYGPWSSIWGQSAQLGRIEGQPFAFTGAFAFGTKRNCAAATVDRGGTVYDSVVDKPMTLVVGRSSPSAPAYDLFEDDIRRADKYRSSGTPIIVIREENWIEAMTA